MFISISLALHPPAFFPVPSSCSQSFKAPTLCPGGYQTSLSSRLSLTEKSCAILVYKTEKGKAMPMSPYPLCGRHPPHRHLEKPQIVFNTSSYFTLQLSHVLKIPILVGSTELKDLWRKDECLTLPSCLLREFKQVPNLK